MAGKKKSPVRSSKKRNEEQESAERIAFFEKQVYDLQQMLEISRSFSSTIELSPLIESILYVAMAQLRVTGAGMFVPEEFGSDFFTFSNNNYMEVSMDPDTEYKIPVESELVEFFSSQPNVYTVPELQELLPGCEDIAVISQLSPSLVVPLIIKNRINGILILGKRIFTDSDSDGYTDYERQEIQTISSLASIAIHNASLFEQSTTDAMTKLKMKSYFYTVLEDRMDSAFSQNLPLSVIMFDIDFFKKFNDTYGHACGDYVLKTVAGIIKENVRSGDIASRYGGEEFTVMLVNAKKEDALIVAERIRKRIDETQFCYENQNMHITISGGISEFSVEENPVRSAKNLVDQADQALYMSKRNGRNQVTVLNTSAVQA